MLMHVDARSLVPGTGRIEAAGAAMHAALCSLAGLTIGPEALLEMTVTGAVLLRRHNTLAAIGRSGYYEKPQTSCAAELLQRPSAAVI